MVRQITGLVMWQVLPTSVAIEGQRALQTHSARVLSRHRSERVPGTRREGCGAWRFYYIKAQTFPAHYHYSIDAATKDELAHGVSDL